MWQKSEQYNHRYCYRHFFVTMLIESCRMTFGFDSLSVENDIFGIAKIFQNWKLCTWMSARFHFFSFVAVNVHWSLEFLLVCMCPRIYDSKKRRCKTRYLYCIFHEVGKNTLTFCVCVVWRVFDKIPSHSVSYFFILKFMACWKW